MTISIFRPLAFALVMTFSAGTATAQTLSLDQAIQQALANSPSLNASKSRSAAAEANTSQAGALANPEVSVEAENILGEGPYKNMNAAEVTYGVSQLVEMPGKRSGRVGIAEVEQMQTHLQMDGSHLNLIRDVTIAYAESVTAIEDTRILEEQKNLATNVLNSVAAKVKAGKEPPIQQSKAEITATSSQIALDRAKRSVDTKTKALKILMGSDGQIDTLDRSTLPELTEPLALEEYRSRLRTTPDQMSLDANVARAQSALSYEKANAVPDPTLNFGVRDFREEGEQAFVAGVSLPIPVFNANRAGIRRAGHELNAATLDQRSSTLSLEGQLMEAHAALVDAYQEADTLEKSVLPGAEDAFDVAQKGYEAGKFSYLEMLDAQRTLFDARQQRNQAFLDYQRQRAILERLSAVHSLDHSHKE